MRRLLLAPTLLLATSFGAMAADAVVIESPPEVIVAPVFNWTGAYIGGQVGYLWGDGDYVDSDLNYATSGPDGWLGGVYVGYNYQFTNNVVLGVDADFAWTGADDSVTAFDVVGAPIGTLDSDLDWTGAARLRLGYAVDRFLPYIAGGVAFGKLSHSAYDDTGLLISTDDDTSVGWTLGAGLEYAFTDNLIGRAEYRYTDFGDFDFTIDGIGATTDLTSNDVRFGLAWKF
ncbi:MAG: porin family protein [Mesorhizobium sp.]|nr:outer membrane protein [Mesorhizobium sp.]MBL8580265.1 porin family protein [Mesorhizobium sp.]